MTDHGSEANVCVEVWVRDLSLPPDDPRTSVVSRLHEFEETGLVDDVSIHVWGKCVSVSDEWADETSPPVRERIADFREWADRNGHTLEPAFRWCEESTMLSEEQNEVIRLPLQCLAIYEGDRLVGVFPCSTDNGTKTVADCLQRLETGGVVDDSNAE